jgi:hypothetical protein
MQRRKVVLDFANNQVEAQKGGKRHVLTPQRVDPHRAATQAVVAALGRVHAPAEPSAARAMAPIKRITVSRALKAIKRGANALLS